MYINSASSASHNGTSHYRVHRVDAVAAVTPVQGAGAGKAYERTYQDKAGNAQRAQTKQIEMRPRHDAQTAAAGYAAHILGQMETPTPSKAHAKNAYHHTFNGSVFLDIAA